jgi:ketosteroid isomerase-like protein
MNVFAREAQGWRLVFSTSRPLPPPADPAPADAEATVRRLAQEFIAGFQTENPTTARRLEEMLADDFQAATSDGRRFVGKRECLEFYARVAADLGARWRQLACEFSIHKVYVFGDGAVAFGQVRFAGRTRGEDQDRLERYWETLVFRREGGQWRLLQEHSTPDNTKPALPPGPGVGPAVVP